MERLDIAALVRDIPALAGYARIEPVAKGWSRDRKYRVTDRTGAHLLLRLSDRDTYTTKEAEYRVMQTISSLGVPMSEPIAFGTAGESVYGIFTWIDGEDSEAAIPVLPLDRQYALGVEAGQILQRFHSIPAPGGIPDWEPRMRAKFARRLTAYRESGIRVARDDAAIRYVDENMGLLACRPQVFQHGDFHTGNLILMPDGALGVIDFNRWDYGDPYEDFYKMAIFSREVSVPFARGQIAGYFEGDPPEDFFPLLALYLAYVILYSVVWAIPYGQDEVDGMIERAKIVLSDYDHFQSVIPGWYGQIGTK